jgi:hypothetical protein
MFDYRLLRAINSGRCFAFVGAGPSSEVGYPSWGELAGKTYQTLIARGAVRDEPSYRKYLEGRRYPELFSQAQLDAGGRGPLLEIVRSLLVPQNGLQGTIYNYLIRWPFACYLTTNFDDELSIRLKQSGYHFATLRNRVEDFCSIRDCSGQLIVKLHSDLQHPDEVVLTSQDYQRLWTDYSGQYYRDKLRQIFEMFDVVVIGHSVSSQ